MKCNMCGTDMYFWSYEDDTGRHTSERCSKTDCGQEYFLDNNVWRIPSVRVTIKKNSYTKEWVVKMYVDDKHMPALDYFTDDKDDAQSSSIDMIRRYTDSFKRKE